MSRGRLEKPLKVYAMSVRDLRSARSEHTDIVNFFSRGTIGCAQLF